MNNPYRSETKTYSPFKYIKNKEKKNEVIS